MIPKYIEDRLNELALLERGWHEGYGCPGEPVDSKIMARVRARFENYEGPRVYLYPTPEGGISAEWHTPGWEDEEYTPEIE